MRLLSLWAAAAVWAAAAFCQTASFPSSVVTDQQLKVVANNCQTTITFPVGTSDTTINVANGTCVPANSIITLDSENIAICASTATQLTVGTTSCPNVAGRGYDGTTAAAHSATGANCNPGTASGCASLYIDAWHHNATPVELEAVETALGAGLANVPGTASGPTVPVTKGGTGVTAAQGTGDTKVELAGTNSGVAGAALCNDANGGATTSGCPAAVPAGNPLQYIRYAPNQTSPTVQAASLATLQSSDYNFPAQSCNSSNSCSAGGGSGASLTGGNQVLLTVAPCPLGVAPNEVAISSITLPASAATITGATNATPIVITDGTNRATGTYVYITGITGNLAANGWWQVTNVSSTSYSLNTSAGSGAYVSGGSAYTPPVINTASALPITANAFVTVSYTSAAGLNGVWPALYLSSTSIQLIGAGVAGTATGGYVSFDNYHPLYVSAGAGTAEAPYIQGGSCTSGAASGTIRITPAYNHSGAFTIASATSGIREAEQTCAGQNGCTINLPAGTLPLYGKLVVGDGDQYSQLGLGRSISPTFDRVHIRGQGKGKDSGIDDTGTVLNYYGVNTAGTFQGALEMRGVFAGSLESLKINGSRNASACANTGLLLLGVAHSVIQQVAVDNNGCASLRGIDVNDYDEQNKFIDVDATTQCANCLALGIGTDGGMSQYGSGNSQNVLLGMSIFGGTGSSGNALYLSMADNNVFEDVITFPGGSGATYGLTLQQANAGTSAFGTEFPSENTFYHCPILGGVNGTAGSPSVGQQNWFFPYQVTDGEPIPSMAGISGFTAGGLWFGMQPRGNVSGADVASASTIVPTGQQFRVTGTTTVNTIAVPYAGGGVYASWEGCITIIPTGALPFGTSGNIAASLTATANVPVLACYIAAQSKWYLK